MSDVIFGTFFDEMRKTEIMCAQVWMDLWVELCKDCGVTWEAVRVLPLTEELARNFAEDMYLYFCERMRGICTDALYESTGKDGRKFMEHVVAVSKKFGFDVSNVCDAPATFSEALARSQGKET